MIHATQEEVSEIVSAVWPYSVDFVLGVDQQENMRFGLQDALGSKGVEEGFKSDYVVYTSASYAIWNGGDDSWKMICWFRSEIDATWAKMKWG